MKKIAKDCLIESCEPMPMVKPELNFSDIILIKVALRVAKPMLIPELQERCDYLADLLEKAEIKVKEQS